LGHNLRRVNYACYEEQGSVRVSWIWVRAAKSIARRLRAVGQRKNKNDWQNAHEIPGKSKPFICRYLSHFSNQFSICIHSKLDARLELNAILSLAIPRPVVRSLSPVTFWGLGALEYSRYIHIAKILAKSSLKR